MAHRSDLAFFRGEDVILRGSMGPVPDGGITGWALTFTVRVAAADADPPSITKSVGSGIAILATTILDQLGATVLYQFDITIDDSDTVGLTVRLYEWDVKRTDDGEETIIAFGTLLLKQEVTR